MGVPKRGEALATSAEETPARGAINAEIVERVGATNVAVGETRGLITPSLKQVIARAPDTILTIARGFADWKAVPAVAEGHLRLKFQVQHLTP